MTPKQRSQFAEKALELVAGSDRLWKVEDIQRELGCAVRHAYLFLKGLYVEDKSPGTTLPPLVVARDMHSQRSLFVISPNAPLLVTTAPVLSD